MKPLDDRSIQGWVLKAEVDHALIRLTMSPDEEETLVEAICFHCQQMAEKYLKCFLAVMGRPFEKTHSIERLLDLCEQVDGEFSQIDPGLLSYYAVNLRYPEDDFYPDAEERREAVDKALSIRRLVWLKLGINDELVELWRKERSERNRNA